MADSVTQNARCLLAMFTAPGMKQSLLAAVAASQPPPDDLSGDDFNAALQKAMDLGWVEQTRPHSFRLTDAGKEELRRLQEPPS